ncbi:MAG: two component, sigma54 specific, transcriptional regulator, Fis family [candidate division NC10 bacterium]|nr:two component, sigma54 specific, transcriptional regulator, Fis family [candidate division NC10 bacterium]
MALERRALVVDSDLDSRDLIRETLLADGFAVRTAEGGESALAALQAEPVDLVFASSSLPDTTGLALLDAIRGLTDPPEVIFITAYETIDAAVKAVKRGALCYITRPLTPDRLLHLTRKAVEEIRLRRENEALRRELDRRYTYKDLIGKSPRMQEVFQLLENLTGTESNVLIMGKSGTGKELVARAIHAQSPRKDRRFVALNCGGLTETLLESELFGHIKGAFTGAIASKPGVFQEADGGTLFLDEIANMPLSMQVKLLRTIQEGEIKQVGSNQTFKVNVRFIAATNRELLQAVEEGVFREDLYYRVNVITITLPDLAERTEDIPLLANHFLEWFTKKLRKPVDRIAEDAMALLMDYAWPGNVRELENCIERAVVLAKGPAITAAELPPSVRALQQKEGLRVPVGITLEDLEREAILRTLAHCNGNRAAAAKMLGLAERTLYRKLRLYSSGRAATAQQA